MLSRSGWIVGAMVGVGSFLLGLAAWTLVIAVANPIANQVQQSSENVRYAFAIGVTVASVVAGVVTLVAVAVVTHERWRTHLWAAVLVGSTLAGLMSPVLLLLLTRFNGCEVFVDFPLDLDACST